MPWPSFIRTQSSVEHRSGTPTGLLSTSARADDFSLESNQEYTNLDKLDEKALSEAEKLKLSTKSVTADKLKWICSGAKKVTELRLIGDGVETSDERERLTKLPDELKNLLSLSILDVRNNLLCRFPEPILSLVGLVRLHLSSCGITTIPKGILSLTNVKVLSLDNNRLTDVPETLFSLIELEELYLASNAIERLPTTVNSLSKLERLDLSGNKLKTFPEGVISLKHLNKLLLSNNQIGKLPENIGEMRSLKFLDIAHNKLLDIPESIGQLESLKYLKLVDNFITKVPKSIVDLPLNQDAFLIATNSLQLPPQYVCENGLGSIRSYYEALDKDNGIHNKRLKMVLLGESRAGKTSLAKALVHGKDGCVKDSNRTVQMDFFKWKPQPEVDKLEVQIVDCAGQRKYLLTHQFFLSQYALYTILVDLNIYDKTEKMFKEKICDWMETVLSKCPDSTILVVGTHKDLMKDEDIRTKSHDIVERINAFSEKIKGETPATDQVYHRGPFLTNSCCCGKFCELFKDQAHTRFVTVSCIEDLEGMPQFTNEVCRIAKSQVLAPTVNCELIPSWIELEEHIKKLGKTDKYRKWVLRSDLQSASEKFGLDEQSAETALKYFNNVGSVSYFDNTDELSKFVIIDSSWLPYLLKELFRLDLKDHHPYDPKFFDIDDEYVEDIFNEQMKQLETEGKLCKRLLRIIWHNKDDQDNQVSDEVLDFLVSLLEDFGMVLKIDNEDTLLVPWFFSDTQPKEQCWTRKCPENEMQVRTRYEFRHCPYHILSGLFDRLAVKSHKHKACEHWKTGFCFKSEGYKIFCSIEEGKLHKLSVVGRCAPNCLRELWLGLLDLHKTIHNLLEPYRGIRYASYSCCPYFHENQSVRVRKAELFDPACRPDLTCDVEDKAVPLDQLRPPIDVLHEYLNRPNNPFKEVLTNPERYIIANNVGLTSSKDFGKCLGLGLTVMDDIYVNNSKQPVEMILEIIKRGRTEESELTRQQALAALRKMDPVRQDIIVELLDQIVQTALKPV